jgi:hypothetical protein
MDQNHMSIIPTLSVVCPIHKMSGKLSHLKKWVTEATSYDDVQVILVHDVGDAETGNELQQFIMNLERKPVLITGKFGSPGAARNEGLNVIRGKWTIFWDSDDVPNIVATLRLIQKFKETDLIVVGQYQETRYNQQAFKVPIREAHNFFALSTNLGIWRILFRSDILKSARFPSLSMAEDLSFVANLNINPNQISYGKGVIYNYTVGFPNQLTSSEKFRKHNQEALYWVLSNLNSDNRRVNRLTWSLISRMSLIQFPKQFMDKGIQQQIWKLFLRRPQHLLFIYWYSLRHLVVHSLIKFHRS